MSASQQASAARSRSGQNGASLRIRSDSVLVLIPRLSGDGNLRQWHGRPARSGLQPGHDGSPAPLLLTVGHGTLGIEELAELLAHQVTEWARVLEREGTTRLVYDDAAPACHGVA